MISSTHLLERAPYPARSGNRALFGLIGADAGAE